MTHADEGTLHAYLEGGLSAMGVVRLESHLAECAACRAQLDEERALVRRSGEILARAEPSPVERPAPTLEALRGQRVRWPVAPLAWAATVVIVLGAGWFTRSMISRRDAPTLSETPAPAVVTDESPRAPAPAAEPPPPSPTPTAAARPEPAQASAVPVGAAIDTTARAAVPPPSTPTPPPSLRVAALADTAIERRRADSVARLGRREAAAEALAAPGPAIAQQSVAMAWPPITTDSARALLGSEIVVVPELPLRGIRGSVLGDSVVLVEQGVGADPGVMIRLYQRRASSEATRAVSSESLARYVGSLRVEILGPLPADSLSKLLEKVRPIR